MGKKWIIKRSDYVRIYEMAKSGMTDGAIAASLGVNQSAFYHRVKKDEALKDALDRARKKKGENAYETFKEFAHHRLPEEARETWKLIDEAWESDVKSESATSRREAARLFERAWGAVGKSPVKLQQHLFVYALVHCNFVVSQACRATGIPVSTVNAWTKHDKGFAELVKGVQEVKKDFFEECLVKLCRAGDQGAILFANRTQNRGRGYGERTEVQITEEITHKHRLDLENVSPEVKRALLEEVRRQKRLQIEDKNTVDAEVEVK